MKSNAYITQIPNERHLFLWGAVWVVCIFLRLAIRLYINSFGIREQYIKFRQEV